MRTRTLDAVLAERGRPRVDMLEIDVEGWEGPVLRSAERTLSRAHPMWVLLDLHPDRGVVPQEIADLLTAHGFELRRPEEPHVPQAEVTPRTKELFAFRS